MEEPLKHFENKLAFETDSWGVGPPLSGKGGRLAVETASSPTAIIVLFGVNANEISLVPRYRSYPDQDT